MRLRVNAIGETAGDHGTGARERRCGPLGRSFIAMVLLGTLSAQGEPVKAQPVTTVITHGFTIGNKGPWVQVMAEAVLDGAPSMDIGAFRVDRFK